MLRFRRSRTSSVSPCRPVLAQVASSLRFTGVMVMRVLSEDESVVPVGSGLIRRREATGTLHAADEQDWAALCGYTGPGIAWKFSTWPPSPPPSHEPASVCEDCYLRAS